MATTSLKLEDAMKERLQRLAQTHKRTPHWLMKDAIAQYVDREEKREKVRQDVLAASNRCEETGLHVTFEEADEWLGRLAAGEDVEPPECHT